MIKEIIFASKNRGKIEEVKKILGEQNFIIRSLLDYENFPDIEETGNTFEENAKLKAAAVYKKFNMPVIADDSGLAVEQLKGAPGVYSARYAGENVTYEENNRKLIEELKSFPESHRAKFLCTAVYFDGEKYIIAAGELSGNIISTPRGTNGFGYDPIFIPEGSQLTLAEISSEEKNKISHRAKAFNKLKQMIK
jgi:XTP/dITP diphosphohydrolase